MTIRVQTKSDIRQTLEELGVRPRKRFGQNFLIDGNLMRRIADSADITPETVVLEVGPGTGGLTDLLAERAANVIAVEIDVFLTQHLQQRFAEMEHVKILCLDVLADKHTIAPEVLSQIKSATQPATRPTLRSWCLVANLAYSIATPLVVNLMLLENPPRRMCFTVQKEVADRIDAKPNTRDYSPVSILLQKTCRIKRIAELPPDVFWPAPEISSTMLRLDRIDSTHPPALAAQVAFIRSGFVHRRKTLRSNIAKAYGPELVERIASEIDLARRPESLAVDEWFDLALKAIVP